MMPMLRSLTIPHRNRHHAGNLIWQRLCMDSVCRGQIVQLAARADPVQRASVLELLQQFEVVVAGNAEQ